MRSFARSAIVPALGLVLATAASAGQVIVVDDTAGPGVDFTSLQAAIDAAVNGDVLLIKAGTYFAPGPGTVPTFSVFAKGLTLAAESGATVNLGSPLSIGGLTAGQQATVRGLRIVLSDSGTMLSLNNDAGSVWVEDCTLSSSSTVYPFLPAGYGAQVGNSSSVVLARCSLTGSTIASSFGAGYDGLHSSGSNVCLYDCQLKGGNGGAGSAILEGGDGAHMDGGFLFASGCSFTAGNGGKGADAMLFQPCSNGANGGDGLHLATGTPAASTIACTFTPGIGGPPGAPGSFPPCGNGLPGMGVRVTVGTHTPLVGPAHHLTVTAVVREGQVLTKTYSGPAGELAFADYSGLLGFTYFEAFRGVLVLSLGSPFITVFEGTLPPGGTLVKTVTINPLSPGTEGIPVYLQAGFYNFSTGIFQGAPSMVLLLDSAF